MAVVAIELILTFALFILKVATPFFLNVVLVLIYLACFSLFESCKALFESAMFYWQVMSSLISATDIWPQWMRDAQVAVMSALNFHFSSLSCSFPIFSTPLAQGMVLLLAPFFLIILVFLTHYGLERIQKSVCECSETSKIYKLKNKFSTKFPKLKENLSVKFPRLKEAFLVKNCKTYSLNILDVAYFPIAESCIAIVMGCDNYEGVSFLKQFPWISCSSSEHTGLLVIAVIQILYVTILSFSLCLYLRCNDGGTTAERFNALSSGDDKWYSSFLAQYTENYRELKLFYFVLRRLTIAATMALLQAYPPVLTSVTTMLLLVFIFIQATVRPLKNPMQNTDNTGKYFGLENEIDMLMLCIMEVSIVCAEMSTGKGDWVQTTLLAFIYVTNAPFVLILCFNFFYRIRDELRSRRETDSDDVHEVPQGTLLSQESSKTV